MQLLAGVVSYKPMDVTSWSCSESSCSRSWHAAVFSTASCDMHNISSQLARCALFVHLFAVGPSPQYVVVQPRSDEIKHVHYLRRSVLEDAHGPEVFVSALPTQHSGIAIGMASG